MSFLNRSTGCRVIGVGVFWVRLNFQTQLCETLSDSSKLFMKISLVQSWTVWIWYKKSGSILSWYKISSKKHEKSWLSPFSRFQKPLPIRVFYLTQPHFQFQFQFNLLSTNKTICFWKQQQKPHWRRFNSSSKLQQISGRTESTGAEHIQTRTAAEAARNQEIVVR